MNPPPESAALSRTLELRVNNPGFTPKPPRQLPPPTTSWFPFRRLHKVIGPRHLTLRQCRATPPQVVQVIHTPYYGLSFLIFYRLQ